MKADKFDLYEAASKACSALNALFRGVPRDSGCRVWWELRQDDAKPGGWLLELYDNVGDRAGDYLLTYCELRPEMDACMFSKVLLSAVSAARDYLETAKKGGEA